MLDFSHCSTPVQCVHVDGFRRVYATGVNEVLQLVEVERFVSDLKSKVSLHIN